MHFNKRGFRMNTTIALLVGLCFGQSTLGEPTLAPPSDEVTATESPPADGPVLGGEDPGAVEEPAVLPLDSSAGAADEVVSAVDTSEPNVPVASLSARELLQQAVDLSSESAIQGQPIALIQVLTSFRDPMGRQQDLIKKYWELSIRTAEYRFSLDHSERLSRLPRPDDDSQRAELLAVQDRARAELREAEVRAITAQYAFAELSRNPLVERLPVAADVPFVGQYRTNFESLFANRMAPPRLRQINRTLPLRLAIVNARASAVGSTTRLADRRTERYAAGEIGVTTVIRALNELAAQRSAFLVAVRDYNNEIAEYALQVAGANVSPDLLVTMLIETPRLPQSVAPFEPSAANSVRQATVTAPIANSAPMESLPTATGDASHPNSPFRDVTSEKDSPRKLGLQPGALSPPPGVDPVPPESVPQDTTTPAATGEQRSVLRSIRRLN
jgi:hypothetical protein